MKLTRTAQGGTLEDFYARALDPSYEYYTKEYDVASRLMLALIHYLEEHHIGFDKSVGTQLHYLTFRELTPDMTGQVNVIAWQDYFTVSYYLPKHQSPWSGGVNGVTTSVADAAHMIETAFTRAFHTPDPAAERHATREWAMTELAHIRLRPERVFLQRIPTQQPESVKAFYQQLQEEEHPRFSYMGTSMLAFIEHVETHQIALPGWVYTQDHDLVFTNVPAQQPGVIVQPRVKGYCVKYFLLHQDAPWPDAYTISCINELKSYTISTDTLERAAAMLQVGIHYLFGSLPDQ